MKKLLLLIFMLFLGSIYANSTPKYFSESNKTIKPNPIYKNTITIPQQSILNVYNENQLDINSISTGNNYNVVLKSDFLYSGKLIASEGSSIKGTIAKLITNANNEKLVFINFTNIITPNGQNIPISGIFDTKDHTGFVKINKDGLLELEEESSIILKQPVTYIPLK